jgi:hypothetical protein
MTGDGAHSLCGLSNTCLYVAHMPRLSGKSDVNHSLKIHFPRNIEHGTALAFPAPAGAES